MDMLNFTNIISVSLPEAFLNTLIGILIIGDKKRLLLSGKNKLLFALAVTMIVMVSTITRALSPNIIGVLFFNLIAYSIVYKYTIYSNKEHTEDEKLYKGKNILIRIVNGWYRPFMVSLFALGYLVTIELLYMPGIMLYLGKRITDIYDNDMQRFIYTLPERVLQIYAVISLWNWDIVLVSLKKYKKIRLVATNILLSILLSEAVFLYAFIYRLEEISNILKILLFLGFTLLVISNFMLFKLITVVTKEIRLEEINKCKRVKKEDDKTYKILYSYIIKNDIDKVKKILEQRMQGNKEG